VSILTLIPTLAQEAASAPANSQAGFYNLFILVVTVLIFVAIAIAYMRGHREESAGSAQATPPKAPAAPITVAAAPVASDDSVLIAVLAAAAYATLGQSVKIVSVQPASPEWSMQGRRDIFLSHQFR
jgi:hypothetical protein